MANPPTPHSPASPADTLETSVLQSRRPQSAASAPQQLTVLVFKDNATARTFRIPMRWITQFGWLLGAIFLTSLVCIGIAVKMAATKPRSSNDSYIGVTAQNAKIQELENSLKEARDKIQVLSTTSASAPVASNTSAPITDLSSEPVIDPKLISPSTPIASRPFLFKALPDQIQAPPSNPDEVPIKMTSPSARWNGKMLKVHFNLQYVSKTPGGQQGRIIILARGPGALLAHPNTILQSVGKDILVDPNKGEYFSVSRFRETKAEFGPINSQEWIKEVEVIIVGSNGQILIHENITPGGLTSKAPVKPPLKVQEKVQEKAPAVAPVELPVNSNDANAKEESGSNEP